VGAASFFSPCSVGLLPAYLSYFLAEKRETGDQMTLRQGLGRGLRLGLAGSFGFFALFLAIALVMQLIPYGAITPKLPYISIAIGALIAILGLILLLGGNLSIKLPNLAGERTKKSIFLFGFAYALASLGCTFPLFLSVVLGGFATGNPGQGALALVAYALGMAFVMIAITMALAVSQEGATRFIRKTVPIISKAAAVVMLMAGSYIVYFWIQQLHTIA
jgi:cytochrome c-type biogenesis protein